MANLSQNPSVPVVSKIAIVAWWVGHPPGMNDIALDVEEDIAASALGANKIKPGYVRSKARRPLLGALRLSLFDRRHALSIRRKALQKAIFLSAFLEPNEPRLLELRLLAQIEFAHRRAILLHHLLV